MPMHFGQVIGYQTRNLGVFVVWVLRSGRGHEYIVGQDAVPPMDRLKDVIARLGPFAYEEGDGLERFKEQLAADAAEVRVITEERQREERTRLMIQREVEARMPRPPEPPPANEDGHEA